MTIETPAMSSASRIPYTISVEKQPNGNWLAQVLGWVDCQTEAPTREAAVSTLKQQLRERLAQLEVIFIDLPVAAPDNPWLKYAGMFENDPLFDEVLEEIASYRRQLDAGRPDLADLNSDF
jgi:hypothetical protein